MSVGPLLVFGLWVMEASGLRNSRSSEEINFRAHQASVSSRFMEWLMTIFEARCLFDVTESMANDSEDGGDSDADDSKLSVSHSSYTRDYASMHTSGILYHQHHIKVDNCSNDMDYIFDSGDSQDDPTYIPVSSPQQNIQEDVFEQVEKDLYISSS
ncbi:hypothetical protein J6590_106339, partial [Homalodisca vitripennis]